MKRILFVLSGHAVMGGGKPAGCYFPEMVHPYFVMTQRGVEVDYTTPGENGPALTGTDFQDPALVALLSDTRSFDRIMAAPQPDAIDADKYDAVFYTGGHGGMFDFPDNKDLISISEHVFSKGGLVTAMCHGPAGLINLKAPSGEYLIKGLEVTGYSRAEEIFYNTLLDIPFVLETGLTDHGAVYSCYGVNQGYVVNSGQVITGQNPMSSQLVAVAIADAMGA
ncbi:MAG: type 1 glutamine amidotransferase domain-containing protein [Desulfobacterales bacterium]|nr:type 1 glutamine amidotransferase domain-containing protein [Desulfobacterales bacterium]